MLTIQDYLHTFENPEGLFKTLSEVCVCKDNYKRPIFCSGGNACVFKAKNKGELVMVKCYITSPPFLHEKYNYLSSINSSYIPNYHYLKDEIYVYPRLSSTGDWHDVLYGEWIKGDSLDKVIWWAAKTKNQALIEDITQEFDAMAIYLLTQEWAHGDIKPENIIISDSGQMTLIDFDAMYFPSCPKKETTELGTSTFQHPKRDKNYYNSHIDDYSLLLISVSLHALCYDLELYDRFHYNDNIILSSEQIFDNSSLSYTFLCEIQAKSTIFTHMLSLLKQDNPKIDKLKELLTQLIDTPCIAKESQENIHQP